MTVNFVYVSFIAIVLVLILVSIYFITSLVLKKANKKKIEFKANRIYKAFVKELGHGNGQVQEDPEVIEAMAILRDNFSKRTYIKSFYMAYLRYVEDFGYSQDLRELLNEVVDYKELMENKIVKKSYRKSYTLYLLAEFRLNTDEVGGLALDSLDDESIYVRNNAMQVISNKGNLSFMLEAIYRINMGGKYFNNRVIVDFLDNYAGDKGELDFELCKKIDTCVEKFKHLFVEHLINTNNDHEEIRRKILSFLESSKNNELLISSTRYFASIVDQRAQEYLLKNMENESWSLRANTATALVKYPSQATIGVLKKSLRSSNYFVRKNAAGSLVKILHKELLFHEAYYNEDRFARDILTYTIETMGISGFEEFKELRDKGLESERQGEKELEREKTDQGGLN